MGEPQPRWPHTGHHYPEWTWQASEKMHTWVNDNLTEAHDTKRQADQHGNATAAQNCTLRIEIYEQIATEVTQRDRAASKRMMWAFRQHAHQHSYVTTYYRVASTLLRNARLGTLTPDWRDQIRAESESADIPDVLRATHTAVVDDLTALPPQPWEPYIAGGDWRAALDAWYHDSIAVQDLHYRTRTTPRPTEFRPPNNPAHIAHQDQSDAGDHERARLDKARENARTEAFYRGGLAAGGEDSDWITWCRQCAKTWDSRDTYIPPVVRNPESWRTSVESLPEYWLHHAPA